jgi:hypothetical protein
MFLYYTQLSRFELILLTGPGIMNHQILPRRQLIFVLKYFYLVEVNSGARQYRPAPIC